MSAALYFRKLCGTMADDDPFIREVDEQIRQDRAQAIWSRYGKIIIAAAVLIVVATAGFRFWDYYQKTQSAAAGDQYLEAIELSNQGNHDEALAALEKIATDGRGQYPALARMRIASELADQGDKPGAMEGFSQIADDGGFPDTLRDIARLRAGLLAVDIELYAEVENRLNALAVAGGPFRHSAREALGIAALKAGENQKALEWFSAIRNDANASSGVRARADVMLNLLAGKGVIADG